MAYPAIPIGMSRMTRQALTMPGAIRSVAVEAYFGEPPVLYVTEYAATGSELDIGGAPVIPTRLMKPGDSWIAATERARSSQSVKVDISGYGSNKKYYSREHTGVTGGVVSVETKLFTCFEDGSLKDDISGMIQNGRVTVDPLSDPIWKFEAEAEWGDWLPDPYQDWIAPVIDTVSIFEDGSSKVRERFQLGMYRVKPYPKKIDRTGGTVMLSGNDALWTLRSDFTGSYYAVAAGTNYSAAVRTILDARGMTRHAIQSTSNTLGKKRSWLSGTPWLVIINDLLRANGFYPLWPDNTGVLRSRRFQKLGDLEPAITYTDMDVVETVTIEPDEERFANHVVVLGNSPSGNKYRRSLTNSDPSSPSSTTYLGFTKGIFEKKPDYATQAAVDDRAAYLMERANSLQVRMEVQTKRLRDFQLYEAIAFDLETNAGQQVADGKWRMDRLDVSMGLDCQPIWIVSQLQPFDEAV